MPFCQKRSSRSRTSLSCLPLESYLERDSDIGSHNWNTARWQDNFSTIFYQAIEISFWSADLWVLRNEILSPLRSLGLLHFIFRSKMIVSNWSLFDQIQKINWKFEDQFTSFMWGSFRVAVALKTKKIIQQSYGGTQFLTKCRWKTVKCFWAGFNWSQALCGAKRDVRPMIVGIDTRLWLPWGQKSVQELKKCLTASTKAL